MKKERLIPLKIGGFHNETRDKHQSTPGEATKTKQEKENFKR